MNSSGAPGREALVEYLCRQLIGPVEGVLETLTESPATRYLMGTLFPRESRTDEFFEDDVQDESSGEFGDERGDDPIAMASQHMPSSVGLSLVIEGEPVLWVVVEAGTYVDADSAWTRRGIVENVEVRSGSGKVPVLDGAGYLQSIWRSTGTRHLVTVALVNSAERSREETRNPTPACLFQVEMRIRSGSGTILPYPTAGTIHRDNEDEELALLYRNVPAYAIGHGCAADWKLESDGSIEVRTEFMPSQVVPDVSYEVPGHDSARSLLRLQEIENSPADVIADLRSFADSYRRWADQLRRANSDVSHRFDAAVDRLLDRIADAIRRMEGGINLLERDVTVRRAFGLANRAMLMQMVHSSEELGKSRKERNSFEYETPRYEDRSDLAWRPFQIAFILIALESLADVDNGERDVVDLIWFPTGGGKTEAYLGLIAVAIFLRRLRWQDEGTGTAVITRYTLRLLTSQQFQRAAALICACELLRRDSERPMGESAISIGMWIGGDSSPNQFEDAVQLLAQIKEEEHPSKSFQLELCPWCGTEIIPKILTEADDDYGVIPRNDSFAMFCPTVTCPFHDHLPVSAVDADLYMNPPTLLIATVDKFARLAWRSEAGVFIGSGDAPGPDLLIQDELHLISGPLGTVTSLYEHAMDVVMAANGCRPKVVASTATIRRADRQVEGLFGRSVFLFPPSGLTADDSFFVKADRSGPGRLYVGVMAQSHTPTFSVVQTAAALLQGPIELGVRGDLTPVELDHFWTLVAYHNSLRELGKTVTLARDDIPARIGVITTDDDEVREIDADEDVIELTSNIPAVQIPKQLEALQRHQGATGCVSFVACTNMISVGVDVDRLGLMLVNGQPKSTSEYIQASSRVGRSSPGLVVVLYSAAKSRDRSHYESFRPYHASLYRQVEPTSVTPFALPARRRALHAALVILVRHGTDLTSNDDAARFDPTDSKLRELVGAFAERAAVADPHELSATLSDLDELMAEWSELAGQSKGRSGGLRYEASGRQFTSLLRQFGEAGEGWETLNSMRNVDVESLLKVRGTY
jgi:hypothetical protein